MARIDVSELMTDPDFIDDVQIISRIPFVNALGENVLNECCLNTVGSVQPASGETLARLPESLQLADVNSFWIKGKITASAPGKYSDVLVFKGMRYLIQTVQDWSHWGEGYCEGTCIAQGVAP